MLFATLFPVPVLTTMAAVAVAAMAVPPVVVVPLVPAGVPAETAESVPADPVKIGAVTVPAGVILEFPPVVPTSPLATTVPCRNLPLSADTSVKVAGQEVKVRMITPEGRLLVK